MKLSLVRMAGALLLAGSASALGVACAETDDPADPASAPDGSSLPAPDGAAPPDAADPDASDAEAAAPPPCSPQGFCPKALPGEAQTLRGVWGDGTGVAWTVGDQGDILRWDGTAWKVHASGLGKLRAVWGAGPTDVWVGGEQGLFHGTGATSSALVFAKLAAPGGAPMQITSIWGLGANDVWVTGATLATPPDSRVLHYTGASTDAGPTWAIDAVSARPLDFVAVWGSAASGVWVAGSRPIQDNEFWNEMLVLRKPVGSTTFGDVTLPQNPNEDPIAGKLSVFSGATTATDGTMWIMGQSAGSRDARLRGTTTNGGLTFTWTRLPEEEGAILRTFDVFSTANNEVYDIGQFGRAKRFDGTEWKQAALTNTKLPIYKSLLAGWSAGKELWIVGNGAAIYQKKP
ncbi:MAG: hypothetical protein JST00_29630 [Deltaproteobacteria bacterium]|nr:hypothetical protein [Deltaproteobacteria bacterium]